MLTFKNASNILDLKNTYEILTKLENSYPDFYDWYWNKIIPDIILGKGQVILAFNNADLVGVSIIKDGDEKKLRALRITEQYQNKGYGLYLIDESLRRLDCDKPLCSVSENMINDYSRIFVNRYGFDLTHVYKSLYLKNVLEYEFNGKKELKNKTNY